MVPESSGLEHPTATRAKANAAGSILVILMWTSSSVRPRLLKRFTYIMAINAR